MTHQVSFKIARAAGRETLRENPGGAGERRIRGVLWLLHTDSKIEHFSYVISTTLFSIVSWIISFFIFVPE